MLNPMRRQRSSCSTMAAKNKRQATSTDLFLQKDRVLSTMSPKTKYGYIWTNWPPPAKARYGLSRPGRINSER